MSGRQRPFLRPVPRRRSAAFLLKPVDLVWLVVLAGASCVLALLLRTPFPFPAPSLPILHSLAQAIGAGSMAIASVGVYLTGLRLKDRATAVISGLLVATSLVMAASAAWLPETLLLAALIICTIFCYSMDWTIGALCLAGLAAIVRADGMSIGFAVGVVALCQRKPYAWAGIAAFIVLDALAGVLWLVPWRNSLELWLSPRVGGPEWLLLAASLAPVAWFLFPYLAEWGTPKDRAKWWVPVLWMVPYVASTVHIHVLAGLATYLPLLPVVFLMIGAGISRLLPAFAGEMPTPLARYFVAAAAVAALIALSVWLEWWALCDPWQNLVQGPVAPLGHH